MQGPRGGRKERKDGRRRRREVEKERRKVELEERREKKGGGEMYCIEKRGRVRGGRE